MSSGDEFAGFAEDVGEVARACGASGVGDDAVGAEEVAAVLDFEVGAGAVGEESGALADEVVVEVAWRGGQRFGAARQRRGEELGEGGGARVGDDGVGLGEDVRLFDGGVAAHDDDERLREAPPQGAQRLA